MQPPPQSLHGALDVSLLPSLRPVCPCPDLCTDLLHLLQCPRLKTAAACLLLLPTWTQRPTIAFWQKTSSMQPSVRTVCLLEPWAATVCPSHLWETPNMALILTNLPSAPSTAAHWGRSHPPSLAPLPHQQSAPLCACTTHAPSLTLMPQWSLKTQGCAPLACTTTLCPGAGVAAWEWREPRCPPTCKGLYQWIPVLCIHPDVNDKNKLIM